MTYIDVEEYASFGRRAAASIIDSLIFGIVSSVIYLLINGEPSMRVASSDGYIQFFSSNNWVEQLFYIAVTVAMWIKFMGTPGKLLLGCHVVDADTKQPLQLSQAVIRYLGYFISLLPLGLGFFWVLWDKRRQGFHDKLAHSIVIVESTRWEDDESQKSLKQLIDELR